MKCQNCGSENIEQANFCKNCGTKLEKENVDIPKNKQEETGKFYIILATIFIVLLIIIGTSVLINNSNNTEETHTQNTNTKLGTHLTIHPKNSFDGDSDSMVVGDVLQVQLKDTTNWKGLEGEKVTFTLKNNKTNQEYNYECVIGNDTVAYVPIYAPAGEYAVHGVYKGNEHYYADETNPPLIIVNP